MHSIELIGCFKSIREYHFSDTSRWQLLFNDKFLLGTPTKIAPLDERQLETIRPSKLMGWTPPDGINVP